jgi:hypothetical protein
MKKCYGGVNRFYIAKTILGGGLAGTGTGGSEGSPTPSRYFFIEMPSVMAATIRILPPQCVHTFICKLKVRARLCLKSSFGISRPEGAQAYQPRAAPGVLAFGLCF